MTSGAKQSRRNFLLGSASLAPLIAPARAHEPPKQGDLGLSPPAPATLTTSNYKPGYFTADEWRFVNAACDRLIPKDDIGPGAVELGVAEYIDRQMQTAYGDGSIWYMQGPFRDAAPEFGYQSKLTPKEQYRLGIRAIDKHCQQSFGKAFADLLAEQQDEVLKEMESGKIKADDVPLGTFFSHFLLTNTLEGYFGDPMYGGNKDMAAWKMIGYPGVRADYADWVDKPQQYPYGPVSIYGQRG